MKWSFVKMMVGHVQASESDRTGREHFELAPTVIYNLLHPSSIEHSTPAVLCRVPLLASKVIPTFYSIAISLVLAISTEVPSYNSECRGQTRQDVSSHVLRLFELRGTPPSPSRPLL